MNIKSHNQKKPKNHATTIRSFEFQVSKQFGFMLENNLVFRSENKLLFLTTLHSTSS